MPLSWPMKENSEFSEWLGLYSEKKWKNKLNHK